MDVQTSMTNSVLVSLWVLAKTIAKEEQEQEMLEDRGVTVRELYERRPEVSKSTLGNMAGEFYDKGIQKMPQCKQKCIHCNGDHVDEPFHLLPINVFSM